MYHKFLHVWFGFRDSASPFRQWKIFFLQEGNEETKIKHTYNCLDDSECLVVCMCLNS